MVNVAIIGEYLTVLLLLPLSLPSWHHYFPKPACLFP